MSKSTEGSASARGGINLVRPRLSAWSGSRAAIGGHGGGARGGGSRPHIDGYDVIGAVGEGAMGTVWRAVQLSTKRQVAIKMLHEGMCWSERARLRFEREIELAARLDHPNIAQVYDSGLRQGLHYYAMQYVDGRPLDTHVREKGLGTRETLALVARVCRAVQHAHQCQVIHRDLKPSNILVTGDGRPYVLDFGLAKALASIGRDPEISHPGEPAGTPVYMSPEQAAGRTGDIDTRTDVYSLGVILYRLTTGRFPHDPSGSHSQVRQRTLNEPIPRPRLANRSIDRELEALLLKALERDRSRRYESPGALADDIERYLAGEPLAAKTPTTAYFLAMRLRKYRVPLALAGLVALTALAIGAYGAVRVRRAERAAIARLTSIHVRHGLQLVDQGDPLGGLVWFAAALRLEQSADRELNHRVRIGAMLRRWPQLVRVIDAGGPARRIQLSADGDRALIQTDGEGTGVWAIQGGADGPVRPWGPIATTAVAFDRSGRYVAVARPDGMVRVWDVDKGQAVGRPMSHGSVVVAAGFDQTAERLVTGCEDGSVRVWDARGAGLIVGPVWHEGRVVTAGFDPSGRRVLTASEDGSARLWDATSGRAINNPMAHDARGALRPGLNGAWISHDGATVATAGRDREVRLWEAETGRLIAVVARHERAVNDVAFAPDDRWVATAGADGAVRVWETRYGRPVSGWLGHQGEVYRAVFSDDGRRVLTACADGYARVWDWRASEVPTLTLAHDGPVYDAVFDAGTRHIFTAGADGTVRVWRCDETRLRRHVLAHNAPLEYAEFSPDGRRVVTAGRDGTARLWDATTGWAIGEPMRHAGGQRVSRARFDASGRHVVTASWDGTARVWEAASGRPVTPPLEHGSAVTDAVFSPDGRWVATGGATGVRLWDAGTGGAVGPVRRLSGAIAVVAFDTPGDRVLAATGSEAASWGARSGDGTAETVVAHGGRHWAYRTRFARDGSRAVTAGQGGAWVWDMATGRAVVGPLGAAADAYDAVFSPDGASVATAGFGQARVWDAATGEAVTPPMAHGGKVYAVAFSADGRMLATACGDGGARVWDARSGAPITPTLWHGGTVTAVQFSPDAEALMTVGGDRAIIWNLAPDRRPADEIVDAVEVLAGRRADATGTLVPLDARQVLARAPRPEAR